MACNCGKKNESRTYTWTSSDGQERKSGLSEVQARAMQIKKGGTYK